MAARAGGGLMSVRHPAAVAATGGRAAATGFLDDSEDVPPYTVEPVGMSREMIANRRSKLNIVAVQRGSQWCTCTVP